MKLDAYLTENGITETVFATVIGVHQSSVHRLRKGAIKPDIETLAKIVEATGGVVTLADFMTAPNAPSNTEAAA